MDTVEKQQAIFREEAYELLEELEEGLLALEEDADDNELINRVFRALHTIKGSGAMFGFMDIANFTHELETAYDLVRDGVMPVSKSLVDISLRSRDIIKQMLDASTDGTTVNSVEVDALVHEVKQIIPQTEDTAIGTAAEPPPPPDKEPLTSYRVIFKPAQYLFATGTNPIHLLDEMSDLGEFRPLAHSDGVPELGEIDPESCYTWWEIYLTTDRGINAIKDVFIFVEDDCELMIEALESHEDESEDLDSPPKKLGEILVDRGSIDPQVIEETVNTQKPIGQMLVDTKAVSPVDLASALAEQAHLKSVQQKRKEDKTAASIRVPADKVDQLVNLVGELVTVQARLSQQAASQNDPELALISEEIERLTAELRDNTMGVRMLPISTTFGKFKRLIRDLAKSLNKEVNLITEGGKTELDKTLIERLNDPLVHIIRNAVDHDIEQPDMREAKGKPRAGTIRLSAAHTGANVVITISGDGAGIDFDAVRYRGIERGLIADGAVLTDAELIQLIFNPGFSTAQAVTDVSGRGVGMDVVKRSIEDMQGKIEITSAPDQGTTVSLRMPLTLAIIDGLLVEIGDGFFVIPLHAVEECIEMKPEEICQATQRSILNLRGDVVPYVDLKSKFSIQQESEGSGQVVIAEGKDGRVGFGVDRVVGQHQTVIKSLGPAYRNIHGLSGASILPDGKVALILDVTQLVSSWDDRNELKAAG